MGDDPKKVEDAQASPAILYVHGAGAQKPPLEMKRELDRIVFGREMAGSRVAYYADILWPLSPPQPRKGFAAAPSPRSARDRAVRLAARPETDPTAAAAAILAASFGSPAPRGPRRSRGSRALAAVPEAAAMPVVADEALGLVEELYRHADLVASRSSARRPGQTLRLNLPDPIFRLVVGFLAKDVVDYLYGDIAEPVRERVRLELGKSPTPSVIVAHSMGTIVLYDVLSEPAFAGLEIPLLVTVGCPLGIGNIQKHLRGGAGRPNPVPRQLRVWLNYADPFDPVAIEQTLRDEFDPPRDFATDYTVNNRARNNHDLTGYLSVDVVRSAIVGAIGGAMP